MQVVLYVVVALIFVGLIFWGTKKFGNKKNLKTFKTLKNINFQDLILKLSKKEKQKFLNLSATSLPLVKTSPLEQEDQFLDKKLQPWFPNYQWEINSLPLMTDLTNLYCESDFAHFLKLGETVLNQEGCNFFVLLLKDSNLTSKIVMEKNYQLVFNHFAKNRQKTQQFFIQNYSATANILIQEMTGLLLLTLANLQSWKKIEQKYLLAFKKNFEIRLKKIEQKVNHEWTTLLDLEDNKEWLK